MGRLAGFTAADVIRRLRRAGFVFDRQAKGSHEIQFHPVTRRRTTVPNHPGELPEGTVRAIVRAAGLSVDEFLAVQYRAANVLTNAALDPQAKIPELKVWAVRVERAQRGAGHLFAAGTVAPPF